MTYTVRIADLPTTIHSFVEREDGHDTIVINSRLSYEQQRECFRHEAVHIREDDFSRQSADNIERLRHGASS